MGTKHYFRKLVRRFTYGMAAPMLIVVMLGCVAFGFLLGWEAFGEPLKINSFYKTGNIAEWVAAIATIVIGYQAWVVARDGHLSRIADVRRQRLDNIRVARARLSRMRHKVRRLEDLWDIFEFPDPEQRKVGNLHHSIVLGSDIVEGAAFTASEMECITDQMNNAYRAYESSVRYFKLRVTLTLPKLTEDSDEVFNRVHEVYVDAFVERSKTVDTASRALVAAIDVEIQLLNGAESELRKSPACPKEQRF